MKSYVNSVLNIRTGGGKVLSRATSSTVAKALQVLEAMAKAPGTDRGVTELAKELGLSKSVVHGLLNTLVSHGFAEYDEDSRRYRLGMKILTLAARIDLDRELRRLATPVMMELTDVTGEASFLMVSTGTHARTVARVLTNEPLRVSMEVGALTSLTAGASGKVLLAYMDPDKVEVIVRRVFQEPGTPGERQLMGELEQIRRRGYAYSESEAVEGMYGLGAPVFGPDDAAVASLSIAGPVGNIPARVPELVPVLLEHAARISERLGYTGRPEEAEGN